MKTICLLLYYLFASRLPASSTRYTKWCSSVRRILLKRVFKNCGTHVNIEKGAYIGKGSNISIGDYSGIGINCRLYGTVSIGKDVMMGPEVIILSSNHDFSDISKPMRLQGKSQERPVVIGNDIWIGTRAIIFPGVKIGDGAIIGAGSIVTHNVDSYAIVAGNPAKVIRYRNKQTE